MQNSQKIYFVSFEGPTLSSQFMELLFTTAQEMFKNKTTEKVLTSAEWNAVVKTKWKIVGLGTIYGYEFDVVIELKNKTNKVKFLSKETDLSIDRFSTSYEDKAHFGLPTRVHNN